MSTRIQIRRDTAAAWASSNPVLAVGEPALETDTGRQKMGDGQRAWETLPYLGAVLGQDADLRRTVSSATTRAASVLSQLPSPDVLLPGVTDQDVEITWGQPVEGGRSVSPASVGVTRLGDPGRWNADYGRLEVTTYSGVDFLTDSERVELVFTENSPDGSRLWFFVDGQPVTPVPGLGLRTAQGNDFSVRLQFDGAARRRVTVHAAFVLGWRDLRVSSLAEVSPAAPRPRIAFVGDSFFGGSDSSPFLESGSFLLSRLLGTDCLDVSSGGTGYSAAGGDNPLGTFGSKARVQAVTAYDPDLIVFCGSINDPEGSAGAPAAAAFAAFGAALPDARHVVLGPQPSNAASSTSKAVAVNNRAVRDAALASPFTVAFVDQIGNAVPGAVPPEYAPYVFYDEGDLLTYRGAIYQFVQTGGGSAGETSPDTSIAFAQRTFALTGTGGVAAPTGDGTRDVMLGPDNTHLTTLGSLALATAQAAGIRRGLASS